MLEFANVMDAGLADAFAQNLPVALRAAAADRSRWPSVLAQAFAAAKAAWPDVHVPEVEYAAYVAKRIPENADVARALEELCTTDLYLACALARQDPRALAAFDEAFAGDIHAAVAHLDPSRALADDVKQVLHARLFVAQAGEPAKVAGFSGKGNLKSWLRAAAIRTALTLVRTRDREVPAPETLHGFADEKNDPELAYLKEKYRGEFRVAFAEAVASLTHRERNLLRHQVLDHMTIDQIGVVYRVHRATAARWLNKARAALVKSCRQRLAERLGIRDQELDSLIALVESRLYESLSGFLRKSAP